MEINLGIGMLCCMCHIQTNVREIRFDRIRIQRYALLLKTNAAALTESRHHIAHLDTNLTQQITLISHSGLRGSRQHVDNSVTKA
jgi:hypothetical protein